MIFLNNPELSGEYLYFVQEVFTPEQLSFLDDYFNNTIMLDAKVGGEDGLENNSEVRVTDINWFNNEDDTAQIYETLFHLVKHVNDTHYHWNLQFLETIQCGVYNVGGHYRLHTDTGLHSTKGHNRKLSFSIVLDSEYEGGELEIPGCPGQPDSFKLERNQAVFFPSSMPHCVKPVTAGVRRSLVGWVRGPNFV